MLERIRFFRDLEGAGGGGSAPPSPSPAPSAPAPTATPGPSAAPASAAPGGSPAPTAAPRAAEPGPTGNATYDSLSSEVKRMLGFDPGAPAEPAAPAAPQAPAATPPATPAQPPVGAAPAEPGLTEAANALRHAAEAIRQGAQPAQPPADPMRHVDLPEYQYQFPQELVALLRSENPEENLRGMAAVAQGVSRSVHQAVVLSMRQEVARAVPNMVQTMIAAHQAAQEVYKDFYDAYPQFNHPMLRQTVVQVGKYVAQQTGARSWTPKLRDAIAAQLTQMLGGLQLPTAPQPNGAAPAAPVFTPSGARPGGTAPVGNSVTEEILSLR